MTAAATTASSRITRCAVCKIDRKGRFVYLDDETEKLLGLSQVELFAKPLAEFLDPADHELIDEITSQFNRYESFYDAAQVTIIDSKGGRIPAMVVVSLNFAAGNPVNYEIIINTLAPSGQTEATKAPDTAEDDFVNFLATAARPSDSLNDAKALVEALRSFTGAQSTGLFETSGDSRQPFAISGDDPEEECLSAQNGDDAVPTPVNCYKALLEITADEEYLVKMLFDEALPDDALEASLSRAEKAVNLIARLLAEPNETGPEYSQADTFSLVDLLDKMRAGAVLFDAEGHRADYNEQIHRLLPMDAVTSLEDLAAGLEKIGFAAATAHFEAYFKASDDLESSPNLELSALTPSGQNLHLSIFRLAPGTSDRSCYGVLTQSGAAVADVKHEPLLLSRSFLKAAMERLQASISAGLTESKKLNHEHHGELKKNGGFHLNCLNNHLEKSRAVLDKLSHVAGFAAKQETPKETDLDLLVDQIVQKISQTYPAIKITLNKSSLPKIEVSQNKAKEVLTNILTHMAACASGGKAGLDISATINAKECRLRIKCDGTTISQKQLDQSFGHSGLGDTRELIRIMGGQLELLKSQGRGAVLAVVFPLGGTA